MTVLQMRRDPKKQPRDGDVLEWLGIELRVMWRGVVNGKEWVWWITTAYPDVPTIRSLDQWVKMCSNTGVKVIKRSEDA